ncbi:MAG: SDR family NAD(P)-dependent oxidoreductase [Burkholderiaceae bacterium]
MSISTVAVITGASKGLGEALALGLINPATHIVVLSRNRNETLAAQAIKASCVVQQIQIDLANPAQVENHAARIMAGLPTTARRYLLINNAGTLDPVGLAENLTSPTSIMAAFSLNVAAAMVLTASFLQASKAFDADCRVLNISSGAGRNPTAGWGVYCATKAALDRYTQVLNTEQKKVRVVALAPGVVDTGMQEHIRASDPDQFPDLPRFVGMHKKGQLTSPTAIATRILTYLNRDDFGTIVLDDIRNYA